MRRLITVKCLETRSRKGMKWRRYRTADGAIWTTYEVPTSVISSMSAARLKALLEGAAKRLDSLNRTARIKARLADKIKPAAIAHQEGVSEAWVRALRGRTQPTA